MSNIPSLYRISQEQQALNELLFEAEGELTPEIEEALAINETNLTIKAESYATSMAMFTASVEAAKAERKRLDAYIKRAENAQERMKVALGTALETFGLDRLEVGTYRISFRKSEAVIVDDEQTIPNDYIVVETKINKAQLKADLKAGAVVSGAHLETRKNIQIR